MKKIATTLCLFLLNVCFGYNAFGQTVLSYDFNNADDLSVSVVNSGQKYSGHIVIPSETKTWLDDELHPVTGIEKEAFSGSIGMTSITIPSSITNIESNAFHNCSGLTSITIPSSVTYIGWGAFANCSGLKSIKIPSSITSIRSSVFAGCSGLTSITIPSSVTNIEYHAFDGCSGLTSITIPSSVTSIGEKGFLFLQRFEIDKDSFFH